MPSELERLAIAENSILNLKEGLDRLREHVSELLTFKNNLEGAMKLLNVLAGLGILGNLTVLIKLFWG